MPHPVEGRALLMIWDGLRPEFIRPELTPNLCALAEGGVRFQNHHAVFPSETRVNASSISTGCYPARHGVVGNSLYVPAVDAKRSVNTGDHRVLQALQDQPEGLLSVPSLGERLAVLGLPLAVVSSGSPGSSYLLNPTVNGVMVNVRGVVMPEPIEQDLVQRFGQFPEAGIPASGWNDYAVQVVLEEVFEKAYPIMVLWLCDPDITQHQEGLGSPMSLQAIRENDNRLGRIAEQAKKKGIHLLVGSDHGFSSLRDPVKLDDLFRQAGLQEDELVSVSGGIHAIGKGKEKMGKLVQCLQEQSWCGPIFTPGSRGGWEGCFPGTFSQELVFLSHEIRSPDIVYSRVWSDESNDFGIAGISFGKSGVATHGTCSPYDMRNVLIAAGPKFKAGMVSSLASGNVDLVPTLFSLCHLPVAEEVDGRVLEEAMKGGPDPEAVSQQQIRPSVSLPGDLGEYRLEIWEVEGTRYLAKGWKEAPPA
ncbi:MAG: alkaline phosphatase family protein [bacterium]|nr:alkaline phosphatase family protein [bacterium]